MLLAVGQILLPIVPLRCNYHSENMVFWVYTSSLWSDNKSTICCMPCYSRRITQSTMHTVCAVWPSVLLRTRKGDRCWELSLLLFQTLNLGHLGIVGNPASSSSDLECGTLGDTEENCGQCVVIRVSPARTMWTRHLTRKLSLVSS